jgi:glucose-6-phosphate dehydrogenase assembly protein OpcA
MTTLWDTTGSAVVAALAAERRTGGAVTSGLALTLVVVVDEADVAEAEAAATVAASRHPMRMLLVIRRQIDAPVPRLDAEVLIGGRLGPGEAVEMRMYGRLALHAESVTLPLLAPDAPVVTWWHGAPPDRIAHDPLGVFADRRITDVARSPDRIAALRQRGIDYAPGDTDLSWTRTTPWRATLASAFDTVHEDAARASVHGDPADPSALLLAGWLSSRLGFYVPVEPNREGGIARVEIGFTDDALFSAFRDGSRMVLRRPDQPDSIAPFPERGLGDLLAEELRRLDADQPYGEALAAVNNLTGLNERAATRVHIWSDPAVVGSNQDNPAASAG